MAVNAIVPSTCMLFIRNIWYLVGVCYTDADKELGDVFKLWVWQEFIDYYCSKVTDVDD